MKDPIVKGHEATIIEDCNTDGPYVKDFIVGLICGGSYSERQEATVFEDCFAASPPFNICSPETFVVGDEKTGPVFQRGSVQTQVLFLFRHCLCCSNSILRFGRQILGFCRLNIEFRFRVSGSHLGLG